MTHIRATERSLVLVLLAWVAAVQPAHAQVITGGIFGTVTEISGSVIQRAAVTITNEETGVTYRLLTDQSGNYAAPQLPTGKYSVSVTFSGFKTATTSDVAVYVGASVRADLKLEVGAAAETVQVTAEGVELQTQDASVGNTISEQVIQNLPVNGRDLLELALLTPTVVQRGTASVSAVQSPYLGSNIPTISGGRGEAVSFTVGGLNINDRVFNTPMEKPPLDSLAEFTVISNDYSAEYGQGDGQIIAELRSGSNAIHGSAYDYVRNTSLNARNYLETQRDIVHYNQFGGAIGGPVVLPWYNGHNRTFFFFAYEGTRSPVGTVVSGLFPTAAMLGGDFSQLKNPDGTPVTIYDPSTTDPVTGVRQPFPGNIIPANRISPIAAKLLAASGTPTATNPNLPVNIQGTERNNTTIDQYDVKFDHNYHKEAFSTRYSFSNPYFFTGSLVQNAQNTQSLRNQLIGQTWSHTFGPTLINELRIGYTRQRNTNVPPLASSKNLQQEAGINNPLPYNLLPYISLQSDTGSPSFTNIPTILAGGNGQIQQQFQIVDNLSWTRGSHNMKVGVDIRRRHWDTVGYQPAGAATLETDGIFTAQLALNPSAPNAFPGGFVPVTGTGSPLADLLLGQVHEEDYGLGNSSFSYRDTMFSWFAQDAWRVTRRLTVSFGLRWDYQSPIGETHGRESWLVTSGCPTPGGCLVTDGQVKGLPYDPIVNPFPGVDKIRNGGINPDRNNYGPRLSVAYLIGQNTVVRAGAGVFYSLWEQYQLPGLVTQPPFGTGYQIRQTSTVLQNSDFQLNSAWTPLPTSPGGFVAPGVVSLNQIPLITNQTPELYDATLAIQHQFSGSTSAEIGYAGKWGRHLADFGQINYCNVPVNQPCQTSPATGQDIRIYSNFGPIYAQTTDADNDYESAYVRFDRRFHNGLAFSANYTYSSNFSTGFDSVSNDIFQGGTDILSLDDPRLKNRKRSLLDVPNRFVAYGVYDLPFGHGKQFGNSASGLANALIGGWQTSLITTFQSGMTLDLSSFGSAYFIPGGQQRLKRLDFRKTGYFFDPTLFSSNPTGFPVPPNSFRGAGINDWDISAVKQLAITERHHFEFRADFFNAFNHAQFEMPQNRIFAPGFGQFLLQLSDNKGNSIRPPRNIELALRYSF